MIIGLTGLAGAGKSSVARILVDEFGFSRRPFAFHLKCMLGALGFSPEVLDGPSSGKEVPLELLGGKTLREAMQLLGTEWGRDNFGSDFWVRIWKAGHVPGVNVVVEDVRFANEAEAVEELGGYVIRIDRDGAGSKVSPGHRSEALGGFIPEFILKNDGSLETLEETVGKLMLVLKREAVDGKQEPQEGKRPLAQAAPL